MKLKATLINQYLNFLNEYLTIEKWAEHNEMPISAAKGIIESGGLLWCLNTVDENGNVIPRAWDFDTIKGLVRHGYDLHWKNKGYTIRYDYKTRDYYIHHEHSTVKLYEPDYNPIDFFIAE